jgi:hypothetical protein
MVGTITTTLSTAYDQKLGKEIVGSNGRRWKDTVPPSEAMPHRGLHRRCTLGVTEGWRFTGSQS